MSRENRLVVLLVEDDPAHAEIVKRNFEDYSKSNRLVHVSNGQDALDYLYHRQQFDDPQEYPLPDLILLDLRLPRVDGLEVLSVVKSDKRLSVIPIVVLTTSAAEIDRTRAYDYHVNSYLVKPVDFPAFVEMMKNINQYWLSWNQYPLP